jgi:hypothetical protein
MTANYVLLERITVGEAGAASVTFNNIPQSGYTDLKIVMSARSTGTYGNGLDVANVQFGTSGGISVTGYSDKVVYGNGASATSSSSSAIQFHIDGSDATANTFGNAELYVPNFTSGNYKSVSFDKVTETNGTTAFALLTAGLWSNTGAITSVKFTTPANGNYAQYSSFSLYGLAAVGTTPVIAPYASGGDIIETDGTYWYHAFLSSGTFTPAKALSCDYLVVAGGGGSDGGFGGGAGAGGLRSTVTISGGGASAESALALAANVAQTVLVGAGGAGATHGVTPGTGTGANGSNSVFASITSVGGGAGSTSALGLSGGSSGGNSNINGSAASPTTNQGYAGGTTSTTAVHGGGGGGAGSAGSNGVGSAPSGNAGAGGNGIYTAMTDAFGALTGLGQLSSTHYYFAGGGGGGTYHNSSSASGGLGGGGTGSGTGAGADGIPNTGGGGGGGSYVGSTHYAGGKGGSGLIILRYAI